MTARASAPWTPASHLLPAGDQDHGLVGHQELTALATHL